MRTFVTHWLNSYIGKPYRLGTSGPDAFDCWNFVKWALTQHYGHDRRILDNINALCTASSSSCWRSLNRPHDGAVVMMEAGYPHVGIWVDADHGGIAHCVEKYGVIFNSLSTLPTIGCRVIGFYRFSQNLQ